MIPHHIFIISMQKRNNLAYLDRSVFYRRFNCLDYNELENLTGKISSLLLGWSSS